MSAPAKILELVERFARNEDSYCSGPYKEAQLRKEFLDPFFDQLGWDLENRQGFAEAYKEVINEDAIKISGGEVKAPDYSFRIGGVRKFFLEAKKPSVNIKEDPAPAFQLRRYAWTAKMPLSILTNFKEFAVYDCRIKPSKNDKASKARSLFLEYEDFTARWDEIAGVFSKDAIQKGSFDKYAESKKGRGVATVDKAFLLEIESWRMLLAKNLAKRNSRLEHRDLNYAVQVTIDRILFLRMCEDRGIEPYKQLGKLTEGKGIYRRLVKLYEKADARYNSGLFHFETEPDRPEQPDMLTPRLRIDDRPLNKIISGLYYPESPYEFSVLSAEILGQVYEQFLGKVIRLTRGHQAKVEDKPEVKKAGGVFYTPAYIVDYIVKQTVGKLLEGKTPKQVAKIAILDPACGSGSFLLGAYQYLLDWHRDRYVEDGHDNYAKDIYQGAGGLWHLTTGEKKRILLNNIYGVDIDPQAVEVTKLSLLLKVLEGENEETLDRQLQFLHERALPDLASNIKCGNSLIAPDFYDGQQMMMFDDEERYRINVFDWKAAFSGIMKAGGFDAVIGNPPYLFITEVPQNQRNYYETRYHGVDYRFDLYGAFIERAALLCLGQGGLFGFIIPHTLLSNDSFRALRALLAKNVTVFKVVDLGPGVFQNARNETMLLFFEVGRPKDTAHVEVVRTNPKIFPRPSQTIIPLQVDWISETGSPWLVHASTERADLMRQMELATHRLGQLCTINQGLRTGDNEKYLATKKINEKWKKAAGGKHIARYEPIAGEIFVLYEPSLLDAPRKPEIFLSAEKIVVQEVRNISLARRIVATLDRDQTFCLQSTNVINGKKNCPFNIRYLLGVLNSNAVNVYFRFSFPGNNHIPSNQLAKIPVPEPKEDYYDQMVQQVENMLVLRKQLAAANSPHDRTVLLAQIDATDRQIDRLVNKLYGLTEEEIKIVEEATS